MGRRPSFCFPPARGGWAPYGTIGAMEITWYGGSCVRLKGREGVVAEGALDPPIGPDQQLGADRAGAGHKGGGGHGPPLPDRVA